MNDNAIQQAYQVFSQGGYNGSIDDFKQLISTNPNALNASYNAFKSGGYADDINTFKTLMGVDGSYPIKKKSPDGVSTSESGSSVSPKSTRPTTTKVSGGGLVEYEKSKQESSKEISRVKDLSNTAEKGSEIFTGYPGKEKNKYELRDGNWYEVNPEIEKIIKKIKADNTFAEIHGTTRTSPLGVKGGSSFARESKEKLSLDAIKNLPKTIVIEDDNRIKALNKYFGKNVSLNAVYEEYDNFFKDEQAGGLKGLFENKTTFDLGLGNVDNNTKYRVKNNSWERLTPNSSSYEKIVLAPSIKALNERYGKNISTDVAPIIAKPKVIDPFLVINSDFLSKTEENAQTVLAKKFGDDFKFEQTGLGTDYIKITPRNGAAPMTFSFDEKSSDEAIRLQSFLRTNASFEKGSSSAEKTIKKNIVTARDNDSDEAPVIVNEKYYASDEYKNAFKELSYFQKRDEIIRRQKEASVFRYSDVGGIVGYAKGSKEEDKKANITEKKAFNNLYNSEEFKLYNSEKTKFEKQQQDRFSLMLDEYEIKIQNGDKEGARQAKLKIESGFSKDVIGDNLTHLSNTQYDLMSKKNDLIQKATKLQERSKNGLISEKEYNIGVEALTIEEEKLKVLAKEVSKNQKEMNALAGVYVAEKAKYGGFGSNLWNSFIIGSNEVGDMLTSSSMSVEKAREESNQKRKSRIITPQQKKYYEDKGYSEEQIKNVLINKAQLESIKANKKTAVENLGFDLTTEESKSKLGFIQNSLVGVAASLPSMLTRAVPIVGQGLAFASMANMSYNAIEEEMLSDPDFETTSKGDRAVVALPYALVMGALENVGLKNMTAGKAGVAGRFILSRVAKIIPKGASREVAENIINSEVKNIFAKGGIKIVRGTLAEFETGLYQAAALDYGLKALYNELDPLKLKLTSEGGVTEGSLTGGELFDTPDTKAGVAMSILEGGVAEAIGGFAMSTMMVGAQGLINGKISLYDQDDLKFFKDFSSDEEFKKIIVSKLKDSMLEGTMTKGEAQAALNDIDLVAGVFNSIDENLPQGAKLEAFNLINEKRRLEKEVEGKDPALSKKSNDRIAEINAKLEELPSKVQEMNLAYRGADIEDALKQRKNKSNTIRIDGKKVDRAEAEAELQTIKTKLEENAIQKQAASEVLVQPTTTVGEEVVQGEPTAEPKVITEEGKAQEVEYDEVTTGAINATKKFLENSIEKLKLEESKKSRLTRISEKLTGSVENGMIKEYQRELELLNADPLAYFKEEVNQGRGSYQTYVDNFKIKEKAPVTQELAPLDTKEKIESDRQAEIEGKISYVEHNKRQEIEGRFEWQREQAKEFNKDVRKGLEDVLAMQENALEEAKKENDALRIRYKAASVLEAKEELRLYDEIKVKYDAKLKSLDETQAEPKGLTEEIQAEEVIPQAENLTLRERMSLEAPVVTAPVAEAPIVVAPVPMSLRDSMSLEAEKAEAPVEAPKAEGTPTTFSWSKIEQYDDTVIREMMRAQNAKLENLLALKNKTTKAQKEEIRVIKTKIVSANKILDARANKEKRIEKRTEKGEVTDKSPRVSGFDQNGKSAEFGVVIDEKKQTAKVQLKKRGTQEFTRQKPESNLKIQTDKKGRFVETQNKSRVYIDEKVTPPKAVELTAFGVPVSTKQEYSKENQKIIENEDDAIEIEKINKDLYTEKISNLDIIKEGGKWVVRTQTEGRVEFTGKTLKEAKDYLANRNLETRVVGFKEAAPATEVKVEAPVVEAKAEPKAEPVKKPTVTAEDTMGVINSIKEDIEKTTNEIKETRAKARKAVNEIEAKILDTKNENQKEELQFDIVDIETQLEEDLEGLKDDLDRQVAMLKEEVGSLKDLDIKKPENKKTLLSYIDGAIATLNSLNKLTYAKLDAGVTLGTLKLILQGIRAGVVAGKGFNTVVRAMATKYKSEHDNKKITIDEFIKEINDYLDSTYVDPQTYKESLEKEIDKFAEIKNAVKQAQSQSRELRKKASNTIKDMLKGKFKSISAVHMKSIMTRLVSVKVENQTQYDKFLEYVDKVIEIADYDTKVKEANVKRKKAKDNTIGKNPKLGDLSLDLLDSLSRMLNINPKLISKEVFDSYYNIVDDLSKRTTILSPGERTDLNEKVNEIVDSIEQNEEMLPDLKDAYDNYANKVVKNGVVDYAKTLTQMLEDGVINNNEFALMKKYKSRIVDAKVKVKMTEQEIADEKAELINEITNTAITLDAIVGDEFRLERELVKRLAKLLNKESLENLDNKQLKNLIKIIENINDGFVSKSTQQMVEKLNETQKSPLLVKSIPKSVKGIFKKISQPLTGLFTRDKYGTNITPLFNIDEVFGDFKNKNIFNSVFEQSAVSQQQYQSEVSEIQGKLVKAESAIASSFNRNENKVVLSKFKMMVYMMQLEYDSNPNSQKGDKRQVHQAMKTLDATIKFAETNRKKSRYTKEDIAQMKAIKEEFEKNDGFEEDGKTIKKIIDIDKLYNSFNEAEKNALKVFDEVNSLMTKKAAYTATVINGNKIVPLKNYIYYNTISDPSTSAEQATNLINNINNNMKPGTESKNLQERSGLVSPVNLDPFFAVNSSAKSVLINYHMTEPIRTARKTLSNARKILEKNKEEKIDVGEQFEILSVIEEAYDTATKDLLETNFSESSNLKSVAQYLTKAGYRAMLGSVTRASAELVSNAAFVTINNPKDMAAGFKYRGIANSGRGKNILTNLKSKVISRNYPQGGLSSNYVDLSSFTDRTTRDGKSRTKYVNGVKQVFDYTVGEWVNFAELVADNLISRPDQIVMKQLYFGAFSREFEKETGIEPDLEKIEANDEEYMDKYQDALEKATNYADNQTVTAGSSMNAYMGTLQNVVRKGDSGAKAGLKTFNQFMNRFTIQEYITARRGVNAAIGRGDITWEEGVQVLAAVSARMTLYLTLGKVFSQALMYLGGVVFGYGDDDDDDEKTLLQTLYQSAVSSATTLFFGRNFGNVVRSIENYFIEQANKEYGEDIGLRNKEYDPFKDAVQYNQFEKVEDVPDVFALMAGPLGPVINAGTLALKLRNKEAPKEDRAIETRRKEWYRLGLEAAGSVGLVPFYRDIRKVQMDWVYDELKKELKEDAAKKVIKDKKDANTLETKTNTLNRMRVIHKDGRSRSIIDDELRKLSDPEYRKEENKKEDDEKTRLVKKYGYDSQDDFERNDKEKYDKVFGNDSPYTKRMAAKAKIRQELKDRMDAAEDRKVYKTKKEKEKKPIDPFKTDAFKTDAFKTDAFN